MNYIDHRCEELMGPFRCELNKAHEGECRFDSPKAKEYFLASGRANSQPTAETLKRIDAENHHETPIEAPLRQRDKEELIVVIEKLKENLAWYVAERNRLLELVAPTAVETINQLLQALEACVQDAEKAANPAARMFGYEAAKAAIRAAKFGVIRVKKAGQDGIKCRAVPVCENCGYSLVIADRGEFRGTLVHVLTGNSICLKQTFDPGRIPYGPDGCP